MESRKVVLVGGQNKEPIGKVVWLCGKGGERETGKTIKERRE